MAWQRGNIAYSSELLPDWRDAVGHSLRKHNKQTDVPSTPPGLEGNWPHLGMKREELAFLGSRSSRKEDRHDSDWRKLPLRRRKIRNHRAAIKPAELPLFAMSQAASAWTCNRPSSAQRSGSRPSGTFFACSRLSRQVALSGKKNQPTEAMESSRGEPRMPPGLSQFPSSAPSGGSITSANVATPKQEAT